MMKFKLLEGQHLEPDRSLPPFQDGTYPIRKYIRGEVIETTTDLCARFNQADPNFPRKFERLYDEQPQWAQVTEPMAAHPAVTAMQQAAQQPTLVAVARRDDGYDAMTVKQLQAVAADEEIDLGTARSKDEIIRIIRAAVSMR